MSSWTPRGAAPPGVWRRGVGDAGVTGCVLRAVGDRRLAGRVCVGVRVCWECLLWEGRVGVGVGVGVGVCARARSFAACRVACAVDLDLQREAQISEPAGTSCPFHAHLDLTLRISPEPPPIRRVSDGAGTRDRSATLTRSLGKAQPWPSPHAASQCVAEHCSRALTQAPIRGSAQGRGLCLPVRCWPPSPGIVALGMLCSGTCHSGGPDYAGLGFHRQDAWSSLQ